MCKDLLGRFWYPIYKTLDLFKANMSNVTYLRLDGSVPPADRHEIVTKFNNDVSIDLLLLSTSVGE